LCKTGKNEIVYHGLHKKCEEITNFVRIHAARKNGMWIRGWEVTEKTRRMSGKFVRNRTRESEQRRGEILVKKNLQGERAVEARKIPR
jgi:hypothetical protein